MKKIILGIVSILMIFSCDVIQDQVVTEQVDVSFGVALPNSNSRNLTVLRAPTVNYTLMNGTAVYMSAANIPLINDQGVFKLNIKLEKNANYKFSQFSVYDEGNSVYLLDTNNTVNIEGFTVDAAGVVTPNPTQVYLTSQLPDEYTDNNSQAAGLTIVEDLFKADNLTLKVSIPAGLTVDVLHYKSDGTISNTVAVKDGDIYDMDSSSIWGFYTENSANTNNDVTIYSRYEVGHWAEYLCADSFAFRIKDNNSSKIYYVYFNSAKYNMKEVIFTNFIN